MTDREPLGKIRVEDGTVSVFVNGELVLDFNLEFGSKSVCLSDLENVVDDLNEGHETRVKEECRKSVDEFRERAARRIESADLYELAESGKPGDRPEFLTPSFSVAEWLANEVRKLPTEPEGK